MKVSRIKTEYMCVNEREGSGTVRLQGEEVKKVQEFKYLGSTVQSNGQCGKEVKKRVQAETVSLRKRQKAELEVAELKMLRFSLGVTRLDRIRNEYIRGTAHVGRLGDKVREARLRWFGYVQRRETSCLDETRQRSSPGQYHPYSEAWWWQHHAVRTFFSGSNWETSQDQGKMNAAMYKDILDENLLQSALDLRLGRRFMFQQDNDPKQQSSDYGTTL
ncbi:hypothetical protein QTP70_004639 [Hemibagrus guttatus]|uniref:Uncharacterized protein n=1 Tax=Hemibagrus guttatus TaxID=175788 RepID=A0AAE0V758_9TELE|nr:hypothetical protein QTP70_004639 [Hemibagrus guttatus]